MNPYRLEIDELEKRARAIRRKIVVMNSESPAGGHTGADLSQIEILTALYFRLLDMAPDRLDDPDRDIYIQSKGHAAGGLYAVLSEAGYFADDWLATYQHNDSRLPGHPVRQKTPGVEFNTGALGHGLPVATGIALAAKQSGNPKTVYVLTGDGELAEGSNWEAALVAAHYQLDNLVIINDKNRLQLAGYTRDILRTDPLADKWRAFGLAVSECEGNDMRSVVTALEGLKRQGKPQVLIANTIKGAGISFIQGRPEWHHRVPKGEEVNLALKELSDGSF
ncbi:MAG: transketolase [Desulfopila sp.]